MKIAFNIMFVLFILQVNLVGTHYEKSNQYTQNNHQLPAKSKLTSSKLLTEKFKQNFNDYFSIFSFLSHPLYNKSTGKNNKK